MTEGIGSRNYLTVALVLCCLVSIVLASTMLPALAGDGLALDSNVPGGEGSPTDGGDGTAPGERTTSGDGGTVGDGSETDGNGTPGNGSVDDDPGPGSDTGTNPGDGTGSGGDPDDEPGDGDSDSDGDSGSASPANATGGAGSVGALSPSETTNIGSPLGPLSETEHFVVESPQPAYWRTAAYGFYTGSGWSSRDASVPYPGSLDATDSGREAFTQTVTLNRSATALPVAWRPLDVRGSVTESLEVTGRRGLSLTAPAEAGTRYTVTSLPQVNDPETLRDAGTEYPESVTAVYASESAGDISERVGPRTAEIIDESGAETTFDAAMAVEEWLESNREYSLNASYEGDALAEHFLFEAESGYCAFFATAMTAMLRTQDVPARYVTGYSTGEPTGEDRYTVRGANAHAWVEVYFPDVGWVKFDPTPGSERLQTEQRALEPSDYDHVEQGSPGEEFDANGSVSDSDDTNDSDDADDSDDGSASLNVTLSDDPVPGETVVVSVSRGDNPVTDRTVRFNGDAIGRTNASGEVSGVVPYARNLTISVADDRTAARSAPPSDAAADPIRARAATAPSGPVFASRDANYTVPTGIDVQFRDEPVPGRSAVVNATIEGVPVRDGRVFVNGERVARTNETGAARIEVPYRNNLSVRVERGEAVGVREQRFPVRVTVSDPVPGSDAEGTVAAAGNPLSNATVAIDGERIDTTGADGGFEFDVPYRTNVTVTAERAELNGSERFSLPTDIALNVSGPPVPEREMSVRATVRGVPVENGTVRVNGERAAATDARGETAVTVPYAPTMNVSVSRGTLAETRAVNVTGLNATVSPALLPSLAAGRPVVVVASVNGTPVPDANVSLVNASGSALTGPGGETRLGLPLAATADIRVSRGGMTTTTSLSGLFLPYFVAVGALVALAGAAIATRRWGGEVTGVVATLVVTARTAVRRTAGALVALATHTDVAVTRLLAALRRFGARFRERLLAAAAWLRALREGSVSLSDLRDALHGRWRRLRARLRRLRRRGFRRGGSETAFENATERVVAAAESGESTDRTVREVWFEFVALVGVRRRRRTTPGEVARKAIAEGYPREAVRDLTDAFREVEYTENRSRAPRLERVREALAAVREALRGEDE